LAWRYSFSDPDGEETASLPGMLGAAAAGYFAASATTLGRPTRRVGKGRWSG
jgi:hypothetical protein